MATYLYLSDRYGLHRCFMSIHLLHDNDFRVTLKSDRQQQRALRADYTVELTTQALWQHRDGRSSSFTDSHTTLIVEQPDKKVQL